MGEQTACAQPDAGHQALTDATAGLKSHTPEEERIAVAVGSLVRVVHRRNARVYIALCQNDHAIQIQTRRRVHDAVLTDWFCAGRDFRCLQKRSTEQWREGTDEHACILKANGSSALGAGTALRTIRKLHKTGKLDRHIQQFHQRFDTGTVVDPTPPTALPAFILLRPKQ